jgi:hypothetical protein
LANRNITAEEYAAWRADPVTEWVTKHLSASGDAQLDAWVRLSWGGGECDPIKLRELQTRADAYHAMADLTFDDLAKLEEE